MTNAVSGKMWEMLWWEKCGNYKIMWTGLEISSFNKLFISQEDRDHYAFNLYKGWVFSFHDNFSIRKKCRITKPTKKIYVEQLG